MHTNSISLSQWLETMNKQILQRLMNKLKNEVFNSDTCNTNDTYSKLMSTSNDRIDKHVPKKTLSIRHRDKVFMNGIIRKRNMSHNLKLRVRTFLSTWKHTYTFKRNRVIDEIRKPRKIIIQNIFHD
jgi:hypothetical protein